MFVSEHDITSLWNESARVYVCAHVCVCVSVAQVRVHVDLLSDPGSEVSHITVNSWTQDFTEADAAPGRQAEQRPMTAAVLTHQWTAAVPLNTHTHTHI